MTPRKTRFRYRVSRGARLEQPLNRRTFADMPEPEMLTGVVNGMEATAPEERTARSLRKNPRVLGFQFRQTYLAPQRNMPGAKEVDFIIGHFGGTGAFQVDGEFSHKTAEQKHADAISDAILTRELAKDGIAPVVRVPAILLDTQEMANDYWDDVL